MENFVLTQDELALMSEIDSLPIGSVCHSFGSTSSLSSGGSSHRRY